MSYFQKVMLPRIIFTIASALVILAYFTNIPDLRAISSELTSWGVVIATVAVAIGTFSLLRVHWDKVSKRSKGYSYSAWTIFVMLATIVIGQAFGLNSPAYGFIFNYWYGPLYSAVYCLIAAYSLSAAYRGFRIKNVASVVLTLAFLLIMLNEAPVVGISWPIFGPLATWINRVPLASGMRVVLIGGAIGLLALVVRIMSGREKTPLGIGGET